MGTIKLGILKEGKVPADRRTPIVPAHAAEVLARLKNVSLCVQSSDIRCFTDDDYREHGITVTESVHDCDILLGVKEVPVQDLLPHKTYLFFSHTVKAQPYNRDLLREVLRKNIRLIDYELLTDEHNRRIIAFGRYAGLAGAYNGILTFGKRYNLFLLRPAHECSDLEDLKTEYAKVKLPMIKIAVTGGGRVAKGAMEMLNDMKIRRVTPADFLNRLYDEPVYTQLNSRDYNRAKNGDEFNRSTFYRHPEQFESNFAPYTKVTDLLIAGAYWDPAAPVLFTREDILQRDFNIKVIADITCDIEGSIPATKRSSVIADPVYDFNPTEDKTEPPFKDEGNITVMAVDNLPCELPGDASRDFSHELVTNVLPSLLGDDDGEIIERATIAKKGKLTTRYAHLQNYVDGK